MKHFCLVLGLLLVCLPCGAQQYHLTSGMTITPVALNDSGLVAGYVAGFDPSVTEQPVVFQVTEGDFAALPLPPGATRGRPRTINAMGHVAGSVWIDGEERAATWSRSHNGGWGFYALDSVTPSASTYTAMDDLGRLLVWGDGFRALQQVPTLNARETFAVPLSAPWVAMNDRGMLVGDHWVLTEEGKRLDLRQHPSFRGADLEAVDVNARGEVLVNATWNLGWTRWTSAAIWEAGADLPHGRVTWLPSRWGVDLVGRALNDAGWVAGSQGSRAILWRSDRGLIDLRDATPGGSGIPFVDAIDVNNGGWIIVRRGDEGFLLRPSQPWIEP